MPNHIQTLAPHIIFRTVALLTYFNLWNAGYVLTFVLVTIFSALDFWTGVHMHRHPALPQRSAAIC